MRSDLYVKGPMLNTFFLGTGCLPKLTLAEVQTLELLRQNPHPSIVRYHGCLTKRDLVVGIVFDRYSETLFQRLEQQRHFDIESCMSSITSAVTHLHSVGLAHNDLNPSNVMVDGDYRAVVIDFGSCQPFGEDLITAGTHGWIDEEFVTSAREHDETALIKVDSWLRSQVPSQTG